MNDPYKKSYILKRILEEGSFEDNYPERALDWDYDDERNQPYKPKSVIRISLCRTAKRNPLIFPI